MENINVTIEQNIPERDLVVSKEERVDGINVTVDYPLPANDAPAVAQLRTELGDLKKDYLANYLLILNS
jgi:hypothetical protein